VVYRLKRTSAILYYFCENPWRSVCLKGDSNQSEKTIQEPLKRKKTIQKWKHFVRLEPDFRAKRQMDTKRGAKLRYELPTQGSDK
jgi:hypothetical protein